MELKQAKAKAKDIVDAMKIKVIELTDKAKEKAKLCIDKAKEKSKKCLDKTKAKQIIEESKKKAKEILLIAKEKKMLALKKAKIKAQQCIDKSKKQKGGDGGYCEINADKLLLLNADGIAERHKIIKYIVFDTKDMNTGDIHRNIREGILSDEENKYFDTDSGQLIKIIKEKYGSNTGINMSDSTVQQREDDLKNTLDELFLILQKYSSRLKNCAPLTIALAIGLIEYMVSNYRRTTAFDGKYCVRSDWLNNNMNNYSIKYNALGFFPRDIKFENIVNNIHECAIEH
jgi:hypothetical protein